MALVAVSWLATGCSSGGSNSGTSNGGTGGTSGDPNTNCILQPTWLENSQNAMCTSCLQKNCCAKIAACAGNADCLKVYKCEQSCYDGSGPDGGAVASDDAGTDDAMNTAMDRCVNDCQAAGTTAGLALYTPQDECVNGTDDPVMNCGAVDVCN